MIRKSHFDMTKICNTINIHTILVQSIRVKQDLTPVSVRSISLSNNNVSIIILFSRVSCQPKTQSWQP